MIIFSFILYLRLSRFFFCLRTTKEKERNRQYKNFFVNEIVSYVHVLQHVVLIDL